ncbi:hypothetical protein [Nitrosospira briensis]|uniref:hypothetical protein n=1 Tax=Nitrosospira briensis TaxID=35799 RepID=UPI001C430045|nr:hypothetical protein [Nitrosospira briensis]
MLKTVVEVLLEAYALEPSAAAEAKTPTATVPAVTASICCAANLIGSDYFMAVGSACATEVIAEKAKAEHTRETIFPTVFLLKM